MTRDPAADLREIARLLERVGGQSRRATAFRQAAASVAALTDGERRQHEQAHSWGTLAGVGPTSRTAIEQSVAGRIPSYLADLQRSKVDLASAGAVRAALQGDLHMHTEWSDGCCPIEEMVLEAARVGHTYCAITDHSPRLRIARGLDSERRARQIDHIHGLNAQVEGFTVLAGIEVDILGDGSLDADAETLGRLDVVVASVHNKLAMDTDAMTMRMVRAISHPNVTILGHVTGRLVGGERGTRGPSSFDAEVVFEACRQFGVAVEINSRPERQDPPDDMLALAANMGCLFSINTDAHAPGHLEFCDLGAARAEVAGITPERIITAWPIDDLRRWLSRPRG